MKRVIKRALVATAIASTTLGAAAPVLACGGSRPRVRNAYTAGYASHYTPARTQYYQTPTYAHAQQYGYSQGRVQTASPIQAAPVQQQTPQQVIQQPAIQQSAVTQAQSASTPSVPTSSPVTSQSRPNSQDAPTPQSNATKPAQDAETSALAALAALAGTSTNAAQVSTESAAPSTAPPQTAPGHVGTFEATLPSSIAVNLQLGNDGTFTWTVNRDGTPKSFSGQYRIDQGKLTLVRSNDLQKMVGTFVPSGNGFKFTLEGANKDGLNFQRV
ncbi:hypothetical protein [Roseiconus lacunae]|uniref:hypothetical protein n=1 Tax=Roseiconus lacunae TaxID=2605694 RepID=UPI001E4A0124|nr:hypothetical protein [Roseiconus lacunae]MCD0459246.1 hypothetical protein [Roseiconus lacunae]